MHRFILPILVSATAITGAAAAQDVVTLTERVSYADLDLDQIEDADALLLRVRSAARDVCGDRPGERDMRVVNDTRVCVRDAIDRAVAELGHPVVTAQYNQAGQRRLASAAQSR